jgi:hypothetical protein
MTGKQAASAQPIVYEDAACRIQFDSHGGLQRLYNRLLDDECLKNGDPGAMPFRIFADPTKEIVVGLVPGHFRLAFDDPATAMRTSISPATCRLLGIDRDDRLTLRYGCEGLEIRLTVTPTGTPGITDWSLTVTNTGKAAREMQADFPCLDGIRPGKDPARNLATAMDHAGLIVPAWQRHGGVLGEANDLSMQWHAVWNPVTKSALGVIFMDADARPKRLILEEPRLQVRYFAPVRLEPGASYTYPQARVQIYEGDWRPAARVYRQWYDHAYAHLEPPAWFRRSDGEIGQHFRRGKPGEKAAYNGQHLLGSWRELPGLHLQNPIDAWEYAFYCQTSADDNDLPYTPHTDGDNVIRADFGGAPAMRDGIAGVHKLGLHTILYVEGYIVHEHSELARSGKARLWSTMYRDGSIKGNYASQGFYHMCPGCVEWQDHLAAMVARLIRETNADGVRLDSLGFYWLPCYNPAHHHATPFGYNDWLKQLLSKVRAAAVAVKPDVLLLVEGASDFLGPYVNGALTARCPRELSPMRLAVGPFRPYVYASGALWASLAGFAGSGGGAGIDSPEWNWTCAQDAVHEALVWGDVLDDPIASDPEIVTRCFEGSGYLAVVAARPACRDPEWPRGTTISTRRAPYSLTLPGLASAVQDAAICDITTLTWKRLPLERHGDDLRLHLDTNWALIVLRKPGGPAVVDFAPLKPASPGATVPLRITRLMCGCKTSSFVRVVAPGLEVLPGNDGVLVPMDALPGSYFVRVEGAGALGMKRFLVVKPRPKE